MNGKFSNLALNLNLPFAPIDLLYGLIACVVAIVAGAWLAKKQARAFGGQPRDVTDVSKQHSGELPEVNFFDYGDMRFLHLGTPWVQGSMKLSKPFDIHLDYVQRMMGWLLLADLDQVRHMHAMQLGLGAASLTKFCHHHLQMHTTAVELNPHVVTACRRWFNLPEDDAKLQVLVSDAADVASQASWHGKINALHVDLYDQNADRPVLDSEAFYRDCRSLLSADGCMTVNLYGRAASYDDSLKKITAAFGPQSVWAFKPTKAGNTVVLACRTARVFDKKMLSAQAHAIQTRWPLPAKKWLKVLAPVPTRT